MRLRANQVAPEAATAPSDMKRIRRPADTDRVYCEGEGEDEKEKEKERENENGKGTRERERL